MTLHLAAAGDKVAQNQYVKNKDACADGCKSLDAADWADGLDTIDISAPRELTFFLDDLESSDFDSGFGFNTELVDKPPVWSPCARPQMSPAATKQQDVMPKTDALDSHAQNLNTTACVRFDGDLYAPSTPDDEMTDIDDCSDRNSDSDNDDISDEELEHIQRVAALSCFPAMRYCRNCTAPLYGDLVCVECQHAVADDDALVTSAVTIAMAASAQSGRVAVAWDERLQLHEEGQTTPHPERPDRIRAVMSRVASSGLAGRCDFLPCREATDKELATAHTAKLLQAVETVSQHAAAGGEGAFAKSGSPLYFTSDTYANQHTNMCARLSAGGCIDVAVAVARHEAAAGVAIVRPPGHHAESNTAMGFCFFNNAVVAARAAQANGAQKVLIVDWDVHHGNGTQHIVEHDNSIMYMSVHRFDNGNFYPGTGAVDEVGLGEGEGFTVNVPWDCGDMGDGDYLAAFQHVLMPIAHEFAPDLVIVSAGFDAVKGDPIGGCNVSPQCYGHMTSMLRSIAPIALLLEGGYNLKATATSVEHCFRVLLGEPPAPLPQPPVPSSAGLIAVNAAMHVQSQYWRSLRMWSATPTLLYTNGGLRHALSAYMMHDEPSSLPSDADRPVVSENGVDGCDSRAHVSAGDVAAACTGGYNEVQQSTPCRAPLRRCMTSVGSKKALGSAVLQRMQLHHLHCSSLKRRLSRSLSRKARILRSIHLSAMRASWRKRQSRATTSSVPPRTTSDAAQLPKIETCNDGVPESSRDAAML